MNLRMTLAASAAAIATLAAAGANAATIYANSTVYGPVAVDTNLFDSFSATAGAATLSFTLDGYSSLDGHNWYEDDFTLTVNTFDIISGTFNLGGGGYDEVYFKPADASVTNVTTTNGGDGLAISWMGGHVVITTPVSLIDGENTIKFNYHALPYGADGQNAGWQDMGDEAWGKHGVLVTRPDTLAGPTSPTPEPAAWALMLTGFFGMGSTLRARRRELVKVRA